MDQEKSSDSRYLKLALIFFGWTAYGLFFASRSFIRQFYLGGGSNWQVSLSIWLTCAYSWAFLTPLILYIARRFPFSRKDWPRTLALQIPLSVFFSILALAIFTGLRWLIADEAKYFSFEGFRVLLVDELHECILVYFGVLCVYAAINFLFGRKEASAVPIQFIDPNTSVPEPPRANYVERFTIKENGRLVFIKSKDIIWLSSEGNYVKIRTSSGNAYLLRETMKSMESKLDPNSFLRVRRSVMVAIEQIRELHPMFNGEFEIVLKSGAKTSSSRRYRKNLDVLLKS